MKRMAIHQIGIKWDNKTQQKLLHALHYHQHVKEKKGGDHRVVMNESKTLFLIQSKLPSPQECELDNIQNNSKIDPNFVLAKNITMSKCQSVEVF
jgi:hypothetical protein